MSEPKFTPGPWHKKGKRVFWQKPEPDLPKDNLFNGLVCICATTEDNPPEVIEEACANAALIAAAPEMYALLERILEDVHWDRIAVTDRASTFCAIVQLLAKARGEKPKP